MSGGASPRRRGDYFERQCKAELEAHGWLVFRSPGSGSGAIGTPLEGTGADLLAITAGPHPPLLISCKLGGKIPTSERRAMVAVAKRHGATPVLATRAGTGRVAYLGLNPNDDTAPTTITR